jgi:hypothetical protein
MTLYQDLLEKMNGVEYSNYWMGYCPFHPNTDTPALMVHEDGFKCKSCLKSGTLKFLAKKVGHGITTFSTKTAILPKWKKWEDRYGDISEIAHHANKSLLRNIQFQGYFKKRKIDQFIKQGLFGYLDGWNLFPVLDQQSKVIDIVVRANKGKGNTRYVLHPDNTRTNPFLYCPNWNRVISNTTIYIPFGIIDAWTFETLELPCITGTAGKTINPEKLKTLNKNFIIIPDRYEEDAAWNLAGQLGWRCNVRHLKYPDGCKDPDDIRIKFGNKYLKNFIGV